ncbi:hydrocephalus-inducing protein homolog [Cuculus canorus]|uniref:hydrocephalus-inducing protein homolog n=1 Tax=Cuculus canorus TaxID=55661 RepID=UPI0023AAC3E5|nr:hydrocephalus-inducing protein homolog [Cuculus canorus]
MKDELRSPHGGRALSICTFYAITHCGFIIQWLKLFMSLQPVKLEAGEECHLSIRFNPACEEGLTSREVEKVLKIQFLGHPHEEQVSVRREVYFPSLCIQTTALDFGCILNDTEAVRYTEMSNCSPIPVRYRWLFLTDGPASQTRFSPPASQCFITPQPPQENIAQSEGSASAESSSREEAAEEPAKGLGAAGDALQKPADANDFEFMVAEQGRFPVQANLITSS